MNANPSVLVPIAPGFEEIEATTIIDVLRRANFSVTTAGLSAGPITGAHGLTLMPDTTIAGVRGRAYEAVVLPGGMPGAKNLAEHEGLRTILQETAKRGAVTAAICAAPWALAAAGLTAGKKATCYPGFEEKLTGAEIRTERVVIDGNLITSRGPATAADFALALVERLAGAALAKTLRDQMLVTA